MRKSSSRIARGIWTGLGTFFLALGLIGIPVPVLPTTPFLLLAAACYLRGSERMYKWLIGNRVLGEYIRNFQEGRGIPVRIKILAISYLWITIGFSTFVFIENEWIQISLITIATAVSVHIIRFKTLRKRNMKYRGRTAPNTSRTG